MKDLLSGPNGHIQAVLNRGQWTRPLLVIGTIGVVSQVEIHQEFPIRQLFHFDVAPCRIGFLARQAVDKWQEIAILVGIKRQPCGLPINVKFLNDRNAGSIGAAPRLSGWKQPPV